MKKQIDHKAIAARLTAVRLMINGLKDALPNTARELRREAGETLDDIIGDLNKLSR